MFSISPDYSYIIKYTQDEIRVKVQQNKCKCDATSEDKLVQRGTYDSVVTRSTGHKR